MSDIETDIENAAGHLMELIANFWLEQPITEEEAANLCIDEYSTDIERHREFTASAEETPQEAIIRRFCEDHDWSESQEGIAHYNAAYERHVQRTERILDKGMTCREYLESMPLYKNPDSVYWRADHRRRIIKAGVDLPIDLGAVLRNYSISINTLEKKPTSVQFLAAQLAERLSNELPLLPDAITKRHDKQFKKSSKNLEIRQLIRQGYDLYLNEKNEQPSSRNVFVDFLLDQRANNATQYGLLPSKKETLNNWVRGFRFRYQNTKEKASP